MQHSAARHDVTVYRPQVGHALAAGLSVIPCFGEKLEERQQDRTLEVDSRNNNILSRPGQNQGMLYKYKHCCD